MGTPGSAAQGADARGAVRRVSPPAARAQHARLELLAVPALARGSRLPALSAPARARVSRLRAEEDRRRAWGVTAPRRSARDGGGRLRLLGRRGRVVPRDDEVAAAHEHEREQRADERQHRGDGQDVGEGIREADPVGVDQRRVRARRERRGEASDFAGLEQRGEMAVGRGEDLMRLPALRQGRLRALADAVLEDRARGRRCRSRSRPGGRCC